ncbi:hypothetical protein HDU79_012036 [Rhizoclosmatium sp. JEL0117]|nr:hypothetical protein HDU79_012036 [Rhizoclosmatium sp. JEL0117]
MPSALTPYYSLARSYGGAVVQVGVAPEHYVGKVGAVGAVGVGEGKLGGGFALGLDALAHAAALEFGMLCGSHAQGPVLRLYARRLLAALAAFDAAAAPTTLVAAVLFARRFVAKAKVAEASQGLEFRLLTTALMVAVKVLDDRALVRSAEWLKVCNVVCLDIKQLSTMEREFLKAIDYNVAVDCNTLTHTANAMADSVLDSWRAQGLSLNTPVLSASSPGHVRVAVNILRQVSADLKA